MNVSRNGVLIRVPFDELGFEAGDDASEVMQRVSDLLGDLVVADFDPDQLGSLVNKSLRMVRIAIAPGRAKVVEVGCALRDALTEEEMTILGLPSDAEDEVVAVADGLEDVESEAMDAMLCGSDGRPTRPLMGQVVNVEAVGVRIQITREAREGLLPTRATVSNVLGNLRVRYGPHPTLVLMRAGRPIWSVAASVAEAVVNRRKDRVDLELRFAEWPDEGICARLGLAGARDLGRALPLEGEAGAQFELEVEPD